MKLDDFKGLRWYIVFVLMILSFFAYSQTTGWMWVGAVKHTPPTEGTGTSRTHGGYRYFHHK